MKAKWFNLLSEKYNAGISNLFLVTGNIADYAMPGILMKDYLINELCNLNKSEVATYDFSEGTTRYLNGQLYEEDVCLNNHEKQTIMKGFKENNPEKDWLNMLNELKSIQSKVVYIIEYPEFIVPNISIGVPDETTKKRLIDLHKLINSKAFLESENILILLTESKANINSIFINSNSRTVPIEVGYPSEEERFEFIQYLKNTSEVMIDYQVSVDKFVKLTAGLSRVNIEDIYLLAEFNQKIDKLMILERKKELMNKEFGEIIELFDTEGYSLKDFAGQEHIKSYHQEVVISPILEDDVSIVPKGLLYMGPPGTGKTYFAKCLAGDANINFVEFKMSKILDKYVGEAERNLEKALNCFKSLAPVGVFIDEIDQVLSRGDNDSNSVNKNIFGMFLSFLSEPSHRGKILWIGATNYPNKLDEALKRAGRFDKKIPFLPPTSEERKEVFKIHLERSSYPYKVTDYNSLIKSTEGYTQAEIENIVVKSLELVKRRKLTELTLEILEESISYMISSQNERIKEMTTIAIDECNDREFLPKNII